jgi:hypothetical protein
VHSIILCNVLSPRSKSNLKSQSFSASAVISPFCEIPMARYCLHKHGTSFRPELY